MQTSGMVGEMLPSCTEQHLHWNTEADIRHDYRAENIPQASDARVDATERDHLPC